MKVSLVIPAYNESGTLNELAMRADKTMRSILKKNDWECIIVNDNSTDNSKEILEKLKEKYPNLKPIHHASNKGQTGCFDSGFKAAQGEIVITLDGDLEVFPEDIPIFIEKMNAGADLVNGIRTNRTHTFLICLASSLYNILMLTFFRILFYDAASNYTAIRTKFVKGINLKHNDHRYIIPIAIRRGAKKFDEVLIRHAVRKAGKSKYSALNKFLWGFFELFGAWYRINIKKEYDIQTE